MKENNSTDRKAGDNAGVKIDTDAFIRQVSVAGMGRDTPKSIQPASQRETISEESKPLEEKPVKRGQAGAADYEGVFLTRNELRNRQGLYIDRDNYEILQTLVRSIRCQRLSVSGLVDNIVRHHIERYEEDINRIYEENIRKPIKSRE
ncbi:MAG: hypothetical protein EZS26_003526 [Candidatus Ordinivivax streblomastigis]|uniref:DUF3408 domain-containing protein n=1 Tax=Candidatus Ordinivivax streblomastigis TaxID=2540710 RepID=A0A5M8NUR2_9BACT|nr:MAG: hypothetical protein EZS26_003526 [Candidatus Ordinivivax streblomastigis]